MARSTWSCFTEECARGKLRGYFLSSNVPSIFLCRSSLTCAIVVTLPQEDFCLIKRAVVSNLPQRVTNPSFVNGAIEVDHSLSGSNLAKDGASTMTSSHEWPIYSRNGKIACRLLFSMFRTSLPSMVFCMFSRDEFVLAEEIPFTPGQDRN